MTVRDHEVFLKFCSAFGGTSGVQQYERMGMTRQEHHRDNILLGFPTVHLFMLFLLLGSACAQNTVGG